VKVFISYCSADDNKREALASALAAHGHTPIVVATRRMPGTPLAEKVTSGIAECEVFVPILTAASLPTQWVNQEIGYAKGIGRPIVPIVDGAVIGSLKGFVHAQHDLPFSFRASPGQSRAEAASFRRAYLRLIAYLAGQQGRTALMADPSKTAAPERGTPSA
jgi:hypothetical protein